MSLTPSKWRPTLTNYQQARVNKVEADIAEKTGGLRGEAEANKYTEDVEQRDLETAKRRLENDLTAAQLQNSSRCGVYSKQPSNSNAKENQCQRSRKHRQNRRCRRNQNPRPSQSLLISTESAKRTDKEPNYISLDGEKITGWKTPSTTTPWRRQNGQARRTMSRA